jgi:hypothetical protein
MTEEEHSTQEALCRRLAQGTADQELSARLLQLAEQHAAARRALTASDDRADDLPED